jgi:hypothetical protein
MNTRNNRRCTQCSSEFIPDRRVGQRQVTCGRKECQRSRHADRCRAWRAANAEVQRDHYQDVVVPFRQQQPDYQRRWRLGQKLREIRDKTREFGGVVLGSLRALITRTEEMAPRATSTKQTGVLSGQSLGRALAALRSILATIELAAASADELWALGL